MQAYKTVTEVATIGDCDSAILRESQEVVEG